jgi:hypothetical protein
LSDLGESHNYFSSKINAGDGGMQVMTLKTDEAGSSWVRNFFAKSFAPLRFAEAHNCNAPAHDMPVKTSTAPSSDTYVCCECGQHWRSHTTV